MLSRGKKRVAVAGILTTSIAAVFGLSAAEYLWVGPTSGNWSDASKWSGNNAPPAGGGLLAELRFAGASGDVSAYDDLSPAFTLNRLSFDYYGSGTFAVNAFSAPLAFAGTAPVLAQNGNGRVSAGALTLPSTGSLTVSGAGSGDLVLSGVLSATGGTGSLVIAGAVASPRAQQIISDGQLNVKGGVRLASGNWRVGASGQLGTDPLTVAGGTLGAVGNGVFTIANSIALESGLDFIGIRSGSLTGSISSSTAGTGATFRLLPFKTVTLTAASTYSGPTVIDFAPVADSGILPYSGAGTLVLDQNASLLGSSQYEVRAGANLSVNALNATSDRLANAAPVLLRGGQLTFVNGIDRFGSTETVGPLKIGGQSTVAITSSGLSNPTTLQIASLQRLGHGTVLFRGGSLGSNVGASGSSAIFFTQAPAGLVGGGGTGPNTSILPYAVGESSTVGTGTSFVTYDPVVGIRPLKLDLEYAASIAAAAPTNNVRLGANETLSTPATVNALNLGSGGLTLSGPGRLTVTSGAILSSYGGLIQTPIAFGAAEAVLLTPGPLTITGNLTGTGGLTKSGAGLLDLQGQNSGLTGPLSINGGTLLFRDVAALPGTGAIAFEGVQAGLAWYGAGTATVARSIDVPSGFVSLGSDTAGTLVVQGVIGGAGGLRAGNPQVSNQLNNAGTLRLSSGNTFTGPVYLSNGRLEIPDDTALGGGDVLAFDGVGTLGLLGAWNTGREIYVPGNGAIDTNGFSANVSGLVTGTGALVKTGAGSLTLSASSPWTGTLAVNAGTLRLAGQGQLRSTSYTVSAAELQLDNTAAALSRLTGNATVTLKDGTLSLLGNAGAPVREKIATLAVSGGLSVIALTPNGSPGTILAMDNLTLTTGDLVVRAPGLGGNARITSTVLPAVQDGFLSRVYASGSATGGESWAVYDATVDAAGAVGIKPFTGYATPAVLPASLTSEVLLTGNVTATGTPATVKSLTLEAGSQLALTSGQTVVATAGRVLTRSGTSATIAGGTLDFGSAATPFIQNFGDLTLDAKITGANPWAKRGNGTLTLGTQGAGSAGIAVETGTLRALNSAALAGKIVSLGAGGTYATGAGAEQLGGVSGAGRLALGGGTLDLGTAPQDFTFTGSLAGSGTLKVVSGGDPMALRTFSNTASGFTGQAVLASGIVSFTSSAAFGSGAITLAGASIKPSSNGSTINQPIVLQSDLRVVTGGILTLAVGSSATGPGGLRILAGGVTVAVPTAFTGDSFVSGNLTVQAEGTLSGTPTIHVPGGTLVFNESSTDSARGARLAATATVSLEGGSLQILGTNLTSLTENIGALQVSGGASMLLANSTYGATSSLGLRAGSISRAPGGTLGVVGLNFGDAQAAKSTQLLFDTAPALVGGGGTGANTSIIPWMIGGESSSSSPDRLVTYVPGNGIRLVPDSDLVASPGAVTAPTNNLRLNQSYQLDTPLAVNALVIENLQSFGNINLSGAGKITLGSGVLVHRNFGADQISNPIDLGNAEGLFYLTGGDLKLTGEISGAAGLTKAGSRILTLGGANTFNGPISINEGNLSFSALGNLGVGTAPIQISSKINSGSSLAYTGVGNATLSRDILISGPTNSLSVTTLGATLSVPGTISGSGSMSYSGQGQVAVLGTNTYTGDTRISANVMIGGDSSLGAPGGTLFADFGTIKLAGPWTSQRTMFLSNGVAVDTNGFDATWSGRLQASTFYKSGAGTLSITGPSSANSVLYVNGGTLRLAGQAEITPFYLSSLGRILLDESGAVSGRRLSSTGTIQLGISAELMLQGNAATPVVEMVGTLQPNQSTITIRSSGASTVLSAAGWTTANQDPGLGKFSLIQGDALGGVTRLVFRTTPTLRGGLLPGVFVVDSAHPNALNFAVYDTTVDALGTIGVRALDLAPAVPVLRDQNHGGATPNLANVLLSGTETVQGKSLVLNSVTVAGQATLQVAARQLVKIDTGWIATPAGSSLSIEGGWLQIPGGESAPLFGTGDVAFRSEAVFGSLKHSENSTFTVGARSFGGFNQYAGQAQLGEGGPLSIGTVTNSGGTLAVNSSRGQIDYLDPSVPPISVTGSLAIGNLASTYGSAVFDLHNASLTLNTVSGTPEIRGSGVVKSTFAGSTYYGVQVTGNFSGPLIGDGGNFSFSSGTTLPNVTRVDMRGGLLQFSSFAGLPQQLPLTALGSRIEAAAPTSTAGPLAVAGSTQFAVTSAVDVTFASLTRSSPGSTVLFESDYALGNAPGAGVANLHFTTSLAPDLLTAGAAVPILPYAVVQTAGGVVPVFRLATYDANTGVRPLQLAEYSSTLQPGANVRLAAGTAMTAPVSLNALQLAGVTLSGSFTAGLSSGVLVAENGGTVAAGSTVDFGARMGYLYSTGSTSAILRLQGTLTGSGGLSFNGAMRTELQGVNQVTGPVVLNSGTVALSNSAALGGTGAVSLYDATLEIGGASFSRDISLQGQRGTLKGTAPGATFSGVISGPGSVVFQDAAITRANTYTGATTLQGAVALNGAVSLGATSAITLGATQIKLLAPLTVAQPVSLTNGAVTIDTNGWAASFTGPVAGYTSLLNKTGAGTLTLAQTERLSGIVQVNGGTLALEGVASLSSDLTVGLQGTLAGGGHLLSGVVVNGTLDPGTDVGAFGVQNATFNNGSTFHLKLASATSYDALEANGTVTLNGAVNLQLELPFDPADNVDRFTVLLNDGTDAVGGKFTYGGQLLSEGSQFVAGGQLFAISYAGGDGNDVVIVAVPEPASALLALFAGSLACLRRPRRQA
ncbi:MAG TPA: autotransporter-associated beta strand repeat-containing protein [Chthoniobacteraceae bacterium]|jgi:autotransporter-associated beta strand protein|nr:autotransporter-associated beta strand repeat-containing protein [Chthoniobacteraceae bacterium]